MRREKSTKTAFRAQGPENTSFADKMKTRLTTIAFDADDTLWQNEVFYRMTQERFCALLADFTDPETLMARMLEAEKRNIAHYGFGIKGFTLSMIETALEVTDNKVSTVVISQLVRLGKDMLSHPVELLPFAKETVAELAEDFQVLLITKGDLLHQEQKLALSGLSDLFDGVEIVSDKTVDVYSGIFDNHCSGPECAMMVGNSMKSDVVPPIEAGAWGVYIPHGETWELEHAEPPNDRSKYYELENLGELPQLVKDLTQ